MVKYTDGGNPIPEEPHEPPPEIMSEPGQEPEQREVTEDPTNSWGCTPKATAAVATIIAVLVIAWFALGNKDDNSEESSGATTTTTEVATTTTTEASTPAAGFAPPDEDSLPAGTVLMTGTSGDQIGHISSDGGSRFLHLERPGVGVGNGEMGPQSIVWPETAKITGFGVDLDTSENLGRYGINLFIPPSTYSAGCSIEKGELGCVATPENIEGTPPIAKDEAVTIIIGEAGNLEAEGAFTLSWWLTYEPT